MRRHGGDGLPAKAGISGYRSEMQNRLSPSGMWKNLVSIVIDRMGREFRDSRYHGWDLEGIMWELSIAKCSLCYEQYSFQ